MKNLKTFEQFSVDRDMEMIDEKYLGLVKDTPEEKAKKDENKINSLLSGLYPRSLNKANVKADVYSCSMEDKQNLYDSGKKIEKETGSAVKIMKKNGKYIPYAITLAANKTRK